MKSVAFTLAVLLATLSVAQATEQAPADQAATQPVDATQPLEVNSTNPSSDVVSTEEAAPAQN